MQVELAGMKMKNPVITASGTFGFGQEYSQFYDISRLGGIALKGTSNVPWPGNPGTRIAETPAGMLNCIGLQNPGVHYVVAHYLPWLQNFDVTKIANIVGKDVDGYVEVAEVLSASGLVDALEVNISCPNVKEGGAAYGTDCGMAASVVKAVREKTKLPLIVKLSPNVTDICEIARAVEAAGADMISMINTLLGMAIDVKKRRPVLGNITGGMSGPAVKPVALRLVYQVYKAVKVPIIGMGGIAYATDAIEFMLAGASAVSVGAANFVNPYAAVNIIDGMQEWLEKEGESEVSAIVGGLRV